MFNPSLNLKHPGVVAVFKLMLPVVLVLIPDTRAQAAASRPDNVAVGRLADLFRNGLLPTTLIISLAYVGHITSFYFVLKWVPKLVVDMGFTPREAGSVLTVTNMGAVVGCLTFGVIAAATGVLKLTRWVMFGTAVMIVLFGQGHATLGMLQLVTVVAGFFISRGYEEVFMPRLRGR